MACGTRLRIFGCSQRIFVCHILPSISGFFDLFLQFLRKASRLQVIQNSTPSTILKRQCDIRTNNALLSKRKIMHEMTVQLQYDIILAFYLLTFQPIKIQPNSQECCNWFKDM